jgi:hypothetical protein
LQENRSAVAEFRQKPLLEKAQSPISFNALEILHGRLFSLSHVHMQLWMLPVTGLILLWFF